MPLISIPPNLLHITEYGINLPENVVCKSSPFLGIVLNIFPTYFCELQHAKSRLDDIQW